MAYIGKKLQKWAIQSLELGFDCFDEGDHAPFVLVADGAGQERLINLENFSGSVDDNLVDRGREIIQAVDDGHLYGLVWDGWLTVGGVKQDAVFVEVGARGVARAFIFAQAYKQKKRSKRLEKLGAPVVVANAAHLWD